MDNTAQVVQRYRRTDQDRLGQWEPVGSRWKSTASSGLVAHDLYHHLPGDTGTFAQEVASLGAEWYIDIQPLDGNFQSITPRQFKSFERNVTDTVLNALDARERQPFVLPVRAPSPKTPPSEMTYFTRMADIALQVLDNSDDVRAVDREDFAARFVANLLQGIAQSKERFPDQRRVRRASATLSQSLADLELNEVPYGHEVTLTLSGYDCRIDYSDADAPFLADHPVVEAVLMPWCSFEPGYPLKEATVHAKPRQYAEFVQEHFDRQDASDLDDAAKLMPQGESDMLQRVYVVTPAAKETLARDGFIKMPVDALRQVDMTPRGVMVI